VPDRVLTDMDDPVDADLERPFLGADRSGGVLERSRVRSGGVGGGERSRRDGGGGVPERRSGERERDNERSRTEEGILLRTGERERDLRGTGERDLLVAGERERERLGDREGERETKRLRTRGGGEREREERR
jgi:hypothetical protein